MNTKEMLIDSVKYSFKNKRCFLFLGILFWSLSFGSDIIGEYPILVIFIIPWFFFVLIEGGYLATVIEDTVFGSDEYPKFENLKKLIWKGIKESLILFTYSIFSFIPLALIFFEVILFGIEFPPLILLIIFIISSFFSIIMVEGAIINCEYNHSKFKAAFEFKTIIRKLRKMGINRFFSSFFIVLLITLLVEPRLTEFSEHLHPLLWTATEFTVLPFLAIFSARFMGLIGRYNFKED